MKLKLIFLLILGMLIGEPIVAMEQEEAQTPKICTYCQKNMLRQNIETELGKISELPRIRKLNQSLSYIDYLIRSAESVCRCRIGGYEAELKQLIETPESDGCICEKKEETPSQPGNIELR